MLIVSSAQAITDPNRPLQLDEIADEAQLAVDLARSGQYGKLSTRQIKLVNAALDTIQAIAQTNASLGDLDQTERRELRNSRIRMDKILRVRNKHRIVCTSEAKTGSRLGRQLCLTVAQREERARNSKRQARDLQRGYCIPGENARCELLQPIGSGTGS